MEKQDGRERSGFGFLRAFQTPAYCIVYYLIPGLLRPSAGFMPGQLYSIQTRLGETKNGT